MRLLVLDLSLFPDLETIETAVAQLAENNEVIWVTPAPDAGDAEWDEALAQVRAADLVITL